ncbi:F-box/kelch-repeat protein-like protein [Tanacetum coccineum]
MSDYVSDDLINDIFERLPAKSLLRFRSLSKSWCSHIQSPDFIHRHALRSRKKTPKILIRHSTLCDRKYIDMYTIHSEDQFVSSNPVWLDVSIPAVKFPKGMGNRLIGKIVGSCNGVLCLFHYNKNTISLWNPSIRHVTTLPSAPNHHRASLVGIGFDPSIDDYKIVRISHKRSFVSTLKTRVWCPIASPTTEVRGRQEFCACFFNGALHWVVEYYNYEISQYILTFHLTTHVFGKIFLPNPNWLTRELTIINGSLAVIPVNIGFYQPPKGKSALQLTTNGHILLNFTHAHNSEYRDMYGVYNPETGTWDPSMIMQFQHSSCKHIETYVESLELLDTKLGQKKINKTDEIATHNVTLRKSELSKYFY